MLFQNQRQTAVKLVWLDAAGERHEYGVVQRASPRLMQTFSGHAWIILDEQGRELGHVIAGDQPARAVIQ